MVAVIVNKSTSIFTNNGIDYVKNFMATIHGESVTVMNAYDTRFKLFTAHYSDVTVDGNSFASLELLIAALAPIIFVKASVSGGGDMFEADYGGSDSNTVRNSDRLGGYLESEYSKDKTTIITWEALVLLGTKSRGQKYNITASADNTKDYGIIKLLSSNVFQIANDLNQIETIIII